jgi:hypothetical protein
MATVAASRPPAAEPDSRPAGLAAESPPRQLPMRWVVAACMAVAALTLLLPSVPTYDPWAWLLWGRQIVELDLVTTGGPSWKPLPMVFIVPFQAIGEAIGESSFAPYAWLWISRTGGLLACVMVFRLARRFVGGGPLGAMAGVVAFASLFSSFKFVRDSALGNSEPLMAALVLWAFERHLDGRRDHALYLGVGAALMRPEIWPFLGIYGLWLWMKEPHLRLRMAIFAVAVPALWLLPEWWGSGNAFRAQDRAQDPRIDSPAFADFPAGEVLRRYKGTVIEPVAAAALIAIAAAAVRFRRRSGPPSERRRDWATLVLTGGAAAWLLLVAAMTQAGYAGNQRYLIIPTAAISVLAGIGVARLVQGAMALARRRFEERTVRAVALATVAVGLAISGPAIAFKLDNATTIRKSLGFEAEVWSELKEGIDEAGGRDALLACGTQYSGAFQTQMIAYELRVKGLDIKWAHEEIPAKNEATKQEAVTTEPPGVAYVTRTAPQLPPVPPVTTDFRPAVTNDRWAFLTNSDSPDCPTG